MGKPSPRSSCQPDSPSPRSSCQPDSASPRSSLHSYGSKRSCMCSHCGRLPSTSTATDVGSSPQDSRESSPRNFSLRAKTATPPPTEQRVEIESSSDAERSQDPSLNGGQSQPHQMPQLSRIPSTLSDSTIANMRAALRANKAQPPESMPRQTSPGTRGPSKSAPKVSFSFSCDEENQKHLNQIAI